MLDEYKLNGKTEKLDIEVEEDVAIKVQKMSEFKNIPVSELVNTALKRFILTHKDFLPPAD